ncbi:MAG: GNAT family N-acetyltransferase [Rubrivivax sp.]|nr:GNAT family N-acetyltransferase [Rubrivivax sp.]
MTAMPVRSDAVTIRALAANDLDAVVALDAAAEKRTRRAYIERRLRAAQREPALHAQFAAVDGEGLVGCMLARLLEGEFGRTRRALRLELFGVRAERRGSHVGRQLFEALAAWGARHGAVEVRSAALWREHSIVAFFDALGFELAPEVVLQCSLSEGRWTPGREEDLRGLPGAGADGDDDAAGARREIDYARSEAEGANDHDRAGHGGAQVSTMREGDLDAIVRIDRGIVGVDRRAYIEARAAEAIEQTGVRVSLTARADGLVAGYLMARADLGDFGRTEPVAVMDTIGVDPGFAQRGVGRALLVQLFANLGALGVERVETVVPVRDLALLGFLGSAGFVPGERLPFARRLS